jgi:hypothetical protein
MTSTWTRIAGAVHALDPAAWRARCLWRGSPPDGAALICIYRSRYVPVVERLVADARRLGMAVALWALEGTNPRLASVTIGRGPGLRMALLNRLHDALGTARGALVVTDDDVVFVRGGLGLLLSAVDRCEFGIAQPAHAPGSHWSHELTIGRPLTLARRTTFVEIGPLIVVSASWRARVVPFPQDFGMGWGLDLCWHDLLRDGCRLGIVDAVTIRHLASSGGDYDKGPERRRLTALLQSRNMSSLREIERCVEAWRVWQWQPPWDPVVAPRVV